MKILFDQGTPVPLRRFLATHVVDTCAEKGWSQLENGDLLREAETGGYDVFVTTDQNLLYQQAVTGRRLAILVHLTTSWPRMKRRALEISAVVDAASPGDCLEFTV